MPTAASNRPHPCSRLAANACLERANLGYAHWNRILQADIRRPSISHAADTPPILVAGMEHRANRFDIPLKRHPPLPYGDTPPFGHPRVPSMPIKRDRQQSQQHPCATSPIRAAPKTDLRRSRPVVTESCCHRYELLMCTESIPSPTWPSEPHPYWSRRRSTLPP